MGDSVTQISVPRFPLPLRTLSRVASDYFSGSVVCIVTLRPLRPLREIKDQSVYFSRRGHKMTLSHFSKGLIRPVSGVESVTTD